MNKEDKEYYDSSFENWIDQRHELTEWLYETDEKEYWTIVNKIAEKRSKLDLDEWIKRGRPDEY